MARTITSLTIYWDSQDSSNEGWAYRASDADGDIDSGPIDGVADDNNRYLLYNLSGAIDQACYELGLDLTHDDFSIEPSLEGGYCLWSAE